VMVPFRAGRERELGSSGGEASRSDFCSASLHHTHTSAYVSIRQHTSAYVAPAFASILSEASSSDFCNASLHHRHTSHTSASVGIRQHTCAYAGQGAQLTAAGCAAFVSIRQNTSANASIRQRT
jgi:hypothetical protein